MSRAKPIDERNPYDFYATPEWCYEKMDFPFHLFKTAHGIVTLLTSLVAEMGALYPSWTRRDLK